ncbi:SAM-dependent methyltransferase [Actinomadura craniellae]|uniref:SAM-dependent methyltransferase n=1 Tax=Actinomadura craniellae TaxID=2231787 RepID=A0A365HF90_9ACTN|nr:SAM-dependent methyltransferase [Actinomadura craniellae]RAY16823.1 SAM-dependent methyltransferase [Actinomadura craniellae]
MPHEDPPVPPGVNPEIPSAARIYDLLLGGRDNYPSDRQAVEEMKRVYPDSGEGAARGNRAWLIRAVRYLAGAGIDQFLDLGTGLPTQENVHEVAQSIVPGSRVMYVDNDPSVIAHGRALLAGTTVIMLEGDLADPDSILRAAREHLDFSRPVAVLFSAVFHFISDEQSPSRIVATFEDAVCSGSHIAISHFTSDILEEADDLAREYSSRVSASLHPRPYDEVTKLFAGLEMVEPGLVYVNQWRPPEGVELGHPTTAPIYGGVGRKP